MIAIGIAGLFNLAVWGAVGLVLAVQFLRSVRLVPTRKAYLVERLGRYSRTLGPGFHWLLPFVEQVESIVDLREETIDVPPQECFTRDEVGVQVDGVLYIEVVEPEKAVYGITDYRYAAVQLAQTTTRSVIGTIDLDRSFEERDLISSKVVHELASAGQAWGIRVHRYEIRNIATPPSVRNAMEKQVTAERDRKAIMHRAEGDRQSAINKSEGEMIEMINQSQGAMQRRINEAEGRAAEIRALADATAESIERIAAALSLPGGAEAVRLRLTERYINQLANLRSKDTKVLLPADLSNLDSLLASVGLRDDTK
jgi:regulator of protease activity HflC (stomatin/prohibitin superfamily)